jgi:hypothetical protein
MRDQIRRIVSIILIGAGIFCAACAHEKPALVSDPDAKKEGTIPWNKQEDWETQGQLQAGATDHR